MIVKYGKAEVEQHEWGSLTWYASERMGNSGKLTLGHCRIKPGKGNPRHCHPNCDEILRVDKGNIIHTYEGQEFEMSVGDTITIPCGIQHNARNTGSDECILTIVFTNGARQTVGEI